MPNCKQLTWKAKEQPGLNRVRDNPEIERFAKTWIRKFRETHEDNFAEKFIYLWVTVNAWASMCVPDATKNHEDAYLIHSMASDQEFLERFSRLINENKEFKTKVDELVSLAPIFQVLWMRNNRIAPWDMEAERREDYVKSLKTQNPYNKGRDGIQYPAFAPVCAFEHFDLNEPVPPDWPHVLHMIYQIRCNLFHGGKSYDSQRDRRFIELAYSILWSIWEYELPGTRHEITWERIFIRSGFIFKKDGNKFDFSNETESNRNFLRDILEKIGLLEYYQDPIFSPKQSTVEEDIWLNTVEDLHGGAEGGNPNDLRIMDTYVSGIIKWINAIGIKTCYSCDGHGTPPVVIQISSHDDEITSTNCLNLLSRRQWKCENRRLVPNVTNPRIRQMHHGMRQANHDRLWLLDVAEKLYHNMDVLKEYITETKKTVKNLRNV